MRCFCMEAGRGMCWGNMWFFYIFGDNGEDNLDIFRYLIYYLLMVWGRGASLL